MPPVPPDIVCPTNETLRIMFREDGFSVHGEPRSMVEELWISSQVVALGLRMLRATQAAEEDEG